MNSQKVAFIICTNNLMWYEECVGYLEKLELPDGFEAEIIQIINATSMASGYNEGMYSSDAKYKIYLHHDLFIVKRDFLKKVIHVFIENPNIGIMGVLGTDKLIQNASYWDHWDSGQVYALDVMRGYNIFIKNKSSEIVSTALALDGMILMTQYDLTWREDIFHGWDFYDVSQCFEFTKKGYEVAVLHEEEISCLHDCGYSKLGKYDVGREIFCREYGEFGFVYKDNVQDALVNEKEKLLEEFKSYLNQLLCGDLRLFCDSVQKVYTNYPKDNVIATLKVICDIVLIEKQKYNNTFFIEKDMDWKALIHKYTKYKFMIRKIEFASESNAASDLVEEMRNGLISVEAIQEIICHCCIYGNKVIEKINSEL